MYQIKPYTQTVTLFNRSGTVKVFASASAAYSALGLDWILANVGKHFVEFRGYSWLNQTRQYAHAEYIMRDADGKPVEATDFYVFRHYKSRNSRYRSTWNGEGPVPGTGRSHGYNVHRNIRSQQARRQAYVLADEGEPPIRAKRSASNIPNSWDDYTKSTIGNNCWKRYRKTQYKS